MMKKSTILCLLLGGCMLLCCHHKQGDAQVEDIIAITQVFGEGQKLTAVAIKYREEISSAGLSAEDFAVQGRTITNVYPNFSPDPSLFGSDGQYVIIELAADDPEAALVVQNGRTVTIKEAKVSVKQTGTIRTTGEKTLSAWENYRENEQQLNLVVDDFIQREYRDSLSGALLPYNLYIPSNYDSGKRYPLVMFIHDAGTTSTEVKTTLVQGLGAVIWATPNEQARNECFVLAPQYATQIVNDDSEASPYLEVTLNLIRELIEEYSIDTGRLYATGQSGGCMMSIAMNIQYPDFFAASFLVAGQWDADQVAPLAEKQLWIVVSEGDEKAFPGMNAITQKLAQEGARVSRAVWNGNADPGEFQIDVNNMLAEDSNVNYTVLRKGTVVPEGMQDNSINNHLCTWRIAYNIEGIRDWLFQQRK